MSDKTEAPKKIYLQHYTGAWNRVYSYFRRNDDDIEYIRADRYIACLDAAVSLHHHLFEITDALLNRPDIGEREMADMIDDAQLALDKWTRFCDGKVEEE